MAFLAKQQIPMRTMTKMLLMNQKGQEMTMTIIIGGMKMRKNLLYPLHSKILRSHIIIGWWFLIKTHAPFDREQESPHPVIIRA
jgi:hypothetical protein